MSSCRAQERIERYLEREYGGTGNEARQQFAKRLKCSIHGIHKWLNGSRIPRDSMKVKIARVTDNWVEVQDWFRH